MMAIRALPLVAIAGALLAAPTPARAADLGGFTLTAQATPVALQIYEPVIPIPASPQLELDLSYSRSTLATGPTGRAVSSLLWPGDGVAYGLPTLLNNPDITYPVKVDVALPSDTKDAKQEYAPGIGMSTHADDTTVQADAYLAKPTLPTIPALPVPGVPIPSMLINIEGFSSESTTTVDADKATATAYATAGSIGLLGGLVKIDGLRADTQAVSDGVSGTTAGTVTWGSLTVAGQTFPVTQDGVKTPLGTTALPTLPANVAKRLADFGLAIDAPKVTETKDGTGATVTGQGLTITLDTAVLKSKLDLGWLLDPFLALLPADLMTQLSPWLSITPKFVFILGAATSSATATPPFEAAPPPPADSGSGLGVGGFDTGSGSSTTGGASTVDTGTITPVASGNDWPVFGGVPWYLFVLGLAAAAGISYGLWRSMPLMFGAGACDRGATNGIPNLRER